MRKVYHAQEDEGGGGELKMALIMTMVMDRWKRGPQRIKGFYSLEG